MPYPDFRELSVANVGSNLRPRAATRDLRASVCCPGFHLALFLLACNLLFLLHCCEYALLHLLY